MKRFVFIFCYIVATQTGWTQDEIFLGGSGDGFDFAGNGVVTTLTGTDLSVLFKGGSGDGFAYAGNGEVTTLTGADLSVLFKGGSGDGFAFAGNGEVTTLTGTDLSVLFQGGSGDGFATIMGDPIILNDFPRIKLAIKMILQGATINPNTGEKNLMRDDLRTLSLLPETSPYGDGITRKTGVFNTGGSTGTGSIEDDIVDWVLVELRSSTDNSLIEASKSALLQRDGDVVDIDGVSPLVINHDPGDYYVAVKHRNHLGIMSAASTNLSQTIKYPNFSSGTFNVYGSYSRINIGGGNMALWAGNANNNSSIEFSGANNDSNTIKDAVLTDPSNILGLITFTATGYLPIDIDMDGFAKFSGALNDSNIPKDNILMHPSNILNLSTFTIQQQLPNN